MLSPMMFTSSANRERPMRRDQKCFWFQPRVEPPSGPYVLCVITRNRTDQSWGDDNKGFNYFVNSADWYGMHWSLADLMSRPWRGQSSPSPMSPSASDSSDHSSLPPRKSRNVFSVRNDPALWPLSGILIWMMSPFR